MKHKHQFPNTKRKGNKSILHKKTTTTTQGNSYYIATYHIHEKYKFAHKRHWTNNE